MRFDTHQLQVIMTDCSPTNLDYIHRHHLFLADIIHTGIFHTSCTWL